MTRFVALGLTLLTGFSGLVYEVAWQKYLATLLGSHSEATAAVLAIFLGGMAVGYELFGRIARRAMHGARDSGGRPHLMRLYGYVELGIGLYALAFPLLFAAAESVSLWMPGGRPGAAFVFDILLTILLIGPPTVLMGGTIPLLTQTLAARLEDATRVHAWIYAFNTLGAFMGALVGGFVLVPLLGLDTVLRSVGPINLLAGAVFLVLDRQRTGNETPMAPSTVASARPAAASFAGYAMVVLLAGFAMMTVQTVLNRVGGLAFGASHFTFSMVVAVFVLCIALGSFLVSALPRIPRGFVVGTQWALVCLLIGLYFVLPDAPYWAHVTRSLFRDVPSAFYPYHLASFAGILAILLVPIGLSGALLPLVFHTLRDEMGDLGSVAGRLYSWNTLGSLLGALLGGYALLFWLDLHQVWAIAVGALTLAAGLLTTLLLGVPRLTSLAVTACILISLAWLPAWDAERLTAGTFRKRNPTPTTFKGPEAFFKGAKQTKLLFATDDPTSTVTVLERRMDGKRSLSIVTNGKSDGNTIGDYTTTAMIALLPALLTDDRSRAFVVGFGSGITAGELAALGDTEEVMIAEISPGVVEAAPLFDFANLKASKNEKVKILRGDAYRTLMRAEGTFGVVASEPSNPWVTGVEMLYSKEFLEAARAKLTPGGVFAQWFHLYEMDRETVQIVLRTYASVFDRLAVWYTTGPDVMLLGLNGPGTGPDLDEIQALFGRDDFRAGFERAGVTSWLQLLSHEVLPEGVVNAAGLQGPIHTLRHPILSDRAARAFFLGKKVELGRLASGDSTHGAASRSLLRRTLGDMSPIPEEIFEEIAEHVCAARRPVECTTIRARWSAEHPDSRRLDATLPKGSDDATRLRLVVGQLSDLFRGKIPVSDAKTTRLARAQAATQLFAGYYHHAFPFDRAALYKAWNHCLFDRGQVLACQRGQSAAEELVGSFSDAGQTVTQPDAS